MFHRLDNGVDMREAFSSEDENGSPIAQFAKSIFMKWFVLLDLGLLALGTVERLHLSSLGSVTRLLGRLEPFVPEVLLIVSVVAFSVAAYQSWRREYQSALHHFEYSTTLAAELARQSRELETALEKVKKMQDAPRSLGMARDMSNRASFEIHSAKKRLDAITAEITHMKDKLDFLNDDLKKPNTSLASAMSVLNQTIHEMKLDAELDSGRTAVKR
jgi:hypothetical protein